MADEPELADDADVPSDPTDDLDLAAMGLEDVELSEEERVAQVAASARPVRKASGETPSTPGKGRATATQKRSRRSEEHRRTTPAQFVRESVAELKKVVWPTGTQLQQYFVVVLVFVVIMISIVALLDLGFGWAMLKALG